MKHSRSEGGILRSELAFQPSPPEFSRLPSKPAAAFIDLHIAPNSTQAVLYLPVTPWTQPGMGKICQMRPLFSYRVAMPASYFRMGQGTTQRQ
jgi:hypothetical protein